MAKFFVYFGNVYLTLEKDADINKVKFFDKKVIFYLLMKEN